MMVQRVDLKQNLTEFTYIHEMTLFYSLYMSCTAPLFLVWAFLNVF